MPDATRSDPGRPDGTRVHGHCDPGFAAVRRVFEENLEAGREVGAALAVYAGDELVVDLWGGLADPREGRPWERGTACPLFSGTKAVTATAALMLWERGLYDVTAPVTSWWPEYGARGKRATTGEHLLSHRAGQPLFDRELPAEAGEDPGMLADVLARQAPLWEPGTDHGYHALTYGWLAGEAVRRLTGHTVGEFVAKEISGPLGLELWLGAPDGVIDRAARIGALPPPRREAPAVAVLDDAARDSVARLGAAFTDPASLISRALASPAALREPGARFNNPRVLRAGWPATGALATARGLAGLYRELAAERLLSPSVLDAATAVHAAGPDRVNLLTMRYGLGFMLPSPPMFTVPPRAGATAFGHAGAGGGFGLADRARGVAMGYLVNGMRDPASDFTRGYRLTEAVYEAVDG